MYTFIFLIMNHVKGFLVKLFLSEFLSYPCKIGFVIKRQNHSELNLMELEIESIRTLWSGIESSQVGLIYLAQNHTAPLTILQEHLFCESSIFSVSFVPALSRGQASEATCGPVSHSRNISLLVLWELVVVDLKLLSWHVSWWLTETSALIDCGSLFLGHAGFIHTCLWMSFLTTLICQGSERAVWDGSAHPFSSTFCLLPEHLSQLCWLRVCVKSKLRVLCLPQVYCAAFAGLSQPYFSGISRYSSLHANLVNCYKMKMPFLSFRGA